jgi:hypothetical protein
MPRYFRAVVCLAVLLAGAGSVRSAAQIRYDKGQDISPNFEGWSRNPDGSFTFHFGYFNRNAKEALSIPVGPDNTVEGGPDRGQPTYFYPGRQWWQFSVVVPKDWPPEKRLVWKLTSAGRTNEAKAWLQLEWEIDATIMFRNARDSFLFTGGSETVTDDENRPPVLTGSPAQEAEAGKPLTLEVSARDDGRPVPGREQIRRKVPQGQRFRWLVYRGPAGAQIDPITSGPVPGNPASSKTRVIFQQPGNYRVRAIASDGQLFSFYDIDVTVKPGTKGAPTTSTRSSRQIR